MLAAALALGAGSSRAQDLGAAPDSSHVRATLVAEGEAPPGGIVHVALRQQIERGWHTYWRNPGDAGQATQIKWTLPQGWRAGDIQWPAPQRLPNPPLMDYGYEGEVLLPVALSVPADARPGSTAHLQAAVSMLVCETVCVPADAVLTLDLTVAKGAPAASPRWAGPIAKTLAALPKPGVLTAAFTREGDTLALSVAGAPIAGGVSEAYFYPYRDTVIDHAAAQALDRGPKGLTLTLTPGAAFKDAAAPAAPAALQGVLEAGGAAYEIDAKPGSPLLGTFGLGPPATARPGSALGLIGAVGLALLGGLILNLMPCVFPVLAMKAAALARHAHTPAQARIQGAAYAAGVIGAFVTLAGVLIAAKAGGAAIGWGYQLQSPPVVAGLALIMLLVGLNLSGVFEVGQSLQSASGEIGTKGGAEGAFLTGALAVVVAAPCTAPFMAAALGFALTQSPAASLLVFAALGAGLAAPFVAVCFAPPLLALMPKPGAWMDVLRKALAFPMYGAAAWLVWVFAAQVGDVGLAAMLAAAVCASLAAWLFGLSQKDGPAPRRLGLRLASILVLVAAGALVWGAHPAPRMQGAPAPVAGLQSVPYSPARLAELRSQGKAVFVDFTADWCVTCKVNERIALSTPGVAAAFARTGAVFMVADWTNRDADIARALAEHGRAGVPLYLVYGKDGGAPKVLPQLLTPGTVVRAVESASKPSANPT